MRHLSESLTSGIAEGCQCTNRSQFVGGLTLISADIFSAETGDFESSIDNSDSTLRH